MSEDSPECPFCDISPDMVLEKNALCIAIRDQYPVSRLHTLVITKRHAETYFDLSSEEVEALDDLTRSQRLVILTEDPSVEGFNIGMNCGSVAGQTVPHYHLHLIPRRRGDIEDPTGGVRNIFLGKGRY
jgi:ATP adenylyltransferase